jgi:hypothetical protein
MTVSKIESDLIEVTINGGPQEFVPGYIRVTAQGGGEFHRWQLAPDQRCWIGDVVTVTVIEDDPQPEASTSLTPPPIDRTTT